MRALRARPVLLVETGTNEPLVELIEKLGYVAHNFENGRLHPRGLERIGAAAG